MPLTRQTLRKRKAPTKRRKGSFRISPTPSRSKGDGRDHCEMDGLVKNNPNQAVSRIRIEVKASMKSSIASHTSRGSHPSPAQAADVSGPQPQPMNLIQKQATPKIVVCPLPCTPRKVAV